MLKQRATKIVGKYGEWQYPKSKSTVRVLQVLIARTRLYGKDAWKIEHIEDYRCPTSIFELARKCQLAESTVITALAALARDEFITVHYKTGKKGQNEYTVDNGRLCLLEAEGHDTRKEKAATAQQQRKERNARHQKNLRFLKKLEAEQNQFDIGYGTLPLSPVVGPASLAKA